MGADTVVTLAQIEAAEPEAVATIVEGWKTSAAAMVGNADTYVRFVTRPGGQDWSGLTRDSMVAMVGEDHRAITDVQTITDTMADTAAAALRGEVTGALKAVTDEIAATRGQRFEVHDDLSVTDPVAMIANNQRKTDLERFQRDIPALAQRWWESEQQVADQINRDKAALVTAFNPRAIGDTPGVLPSPAGSAPEGVVVKASGTEQQPGAPRTWQDMLLPAGAADGSQAGTPGLDAMLTVGKPSDPDMPQDYDEATEAIAPGVNAAVAQQRQAAVDKAKAGVPSVQDLAADPETVATVRAMLTAQGMPADDDAVDRALHSAHDFAQRLATTPNAPEPAAAPQPGPGFADRLKDASLTFDQIGREVGDGLADTGEATLDGLKALPNLVGLGGEDAPGILDSWKGLGEGILGIPEAIVNEAQDVISPPEGSTRAREIGQVLPDLAGLTGLGKATLTHALEHAAPDGLDYATTHPPSEGIPTAGLHPTVVAGDIAPHHAPNEGGTAPVLPGHPATVDAPAFSHPELSQHTQDQVLAFDKGMRPDPMSYLSPEFVHEHLAKFDDGASRIMPERNYERYGIGQTDGTSFVMTRSDVDELLRTTHGNPTAMEDALGLPSGFLEDNTLVRVDIPNPRDYDLRIPSGNEAGANDKWLPGGLLPGEIPEAVVDGGRIPPRDYSVNQIPRERGES